MTKTIVQSAYSRYIGFFDLLGFSRTVETHSIEEVLNLFEQIFRAILLSWYNQMENLALEMVASGQSNRFFNSPLYKKLKDVSTHLQKPESVSSKDFLDAVLKQIFPIKILILSDSIIICSDPINSKEERLIGFEVIVSLCRELMAVSFLNGIPLRGAISYGEVYLDEPRSVFFGKTFLESIKMEKDQEWIGCTLCDSMNLIADEYLTVMNESANPILWRASYLGPVTRHSIHQYDVPMKNSRKEKKLVINWAGSLIGKLKFNESLFEHALTGVLSIDIKYKNTLEYLLWWEDTLNKALSKGKIII